MKRERGKENDRFIVTFQRNHFSRIAEIVDRYNKMGIDEISMVATTGMANFQQVYSMLGDLKARYLEMIFSIHLHKTSGMALANVIEALQ